MPRSKYKTRKDGLKEYAPIFKNYGPSNYSGRPHFYGKTDREIDQKVEEFKAQLNRAPSAETKMMVDVVDDWWEEKEPQLSLNSVSSFSSKKEEIREHFKDYNVREINAQLIYEWLDIVAAQGYAQRGISDRKSVLNIIMTYALRKGYIDTNPCVAVKGVKGKPAKKRKAASEKDVEKIELSKNDSLISKMFYFMEYTGCRIGECVVLQQKDIDVVNHKARIYKDLAFSNQKPVVQDRTKTEAGTREIDLYDNVIEILPTYDDPNTYIFFPEGLPRKSPYETAIKKYRKKFNIQATAHQLRHTYAGIMHSAEVDAKDTQTLMGHSNINVTLDIYTELERTHKESVRNKANQYIMEKRLMQSIRKCPVCGSVYMKAADGHHFSFCPDCGASLKTLIEQSETA